MRRAALALVPVLLALAGPALAREEDYLARFDGDFSGQGEVRRKINKDPTSVSCDIEGRHDGDRLMLDGSCSAYLIFSRDISAEVRADPEGNYVGTYEGAKGGPAALAGRRNGDTLDLEITWNKRVNGDHTARLAITNRGDGRFTITLDDQDDGEGPQIRVSEITLSQ